MMSPDCDPSFTSTFDEGLDKFKMRDAYIWFKVKKTQVEMFRDRGLVIPEEEKFLLEYNPEVEKIKEWELRTLRRFVERYREIATQEGTNFNSALSQVYVDEAMGIQTIAIYLCRKTEASSISAEELTSKFQYYRDMYYRDGSELKMVFISEVDLNKEKISCLHYIKCQFFLTRELKTNPTQFIYYYPHVLLDEEGRIKELSDNNIRPDQLPIILEDDAIVKYFDWKRGGIVKIYRTERYLETPAPKGYYLRLIK